MKRYKGYSWPVVMCVFEVCMGVENAHMWLKYVISGSPRRRTPKIPQAWKVVIYYKELL